MQLVMVFDVVFVLEVKLLGAQLDAASLRSFERSSDFEQIFEILPREGDELLRLCSDDFFDKVLENSGEFIWYFNLFGGENSHLSDV